MRESTQILIIGGGPAGSTAAGLLAREGFQVTLLERDRFPRYHIGESILPSCRPIFETLGVWDKIESHGFQPKGGAYFQWGSEEWEVVFNNMGDDTPNAWQVVRSEFDKILLDHAAELGVEVLEGVSVRDIEFDGDRAVAAQWYETKAPDRRGRLAFDYVIDASGRGGVFATRHLKSRRFHDVFRNVAAWAYWKNAKPLDRGPKGAIAVCSLPNGWFWAIPLHDGTVSIGLVTGVHLATYSAMLGAASVASVLRGEVAEQDAQRFYSTVYRHAYQRLLVLVSVFYESYRGKEYHFYNAQRLTSDERDRLEVQAAFDRIVTGIADLNDAEQAYKLVQDHLNGAESGDPNPLANLNRVHEIKQSPFNPANAVDGLYLVTQPRLGLGSHASVLSEAS